MKELHIDRFDALLSLAAAECVRDEAAAFLSADVSEIEDDPKMLRKILGVSRQSKWKAIKLVVLVALLCMSIAFTACMLVPEIRNAVWNVLVKGRDSSVEVGFETGSATGFVTQPAIEGYPKTIEKKMELSYVPDGYIKTDEFLSAKQYQVDYRTVDGIWKFNVMQSVIEGTNSFLNDQLGQIACVDIGGLKAILIEYDTEERLYSLTWQNDQYRYTLYGSFSSMKEIMKVAEGIK